MSRLFRLYFVDAHTDSYDSFPRFHRPQMEEKDEVLFPAVTVCNFNIIKLSELKNSRFVALKDLESMSSEGDCTVQINIGAN